MKIQSEGVTRTLDSLGRLTIPKGTRSRYGCTPGTEYEIYTIEVDGKTYIAFGPVEEDKR